MSGILKCFSRMIVFYAHKLSMRFYYCPHFMETETLRNLITGVARDTGPRAGARPLGILNVKLDMVKTLQRLSKLGKSY